MELTSYLTEGLVAFKDSLRLTKIANKIEQRSTMSNPEIDIVVSKLRAIASIFQAVEKKYKEDPQSAKEEYAILKKKYSDFVDIINKKSFTLALKSIGGLGIIAAAVLVGYKNLDLLGNQKQSIVMDAKVNSIVNGLAAGGAAATAIGITEMFKKLFHNNADELFEKTRSALFTLEKVEGMKKIEKVGTDV